MYNQQRFMNKADAEKVAAQVRADDKEWTYAVEKASDHHYYIVVYDDMGERVGVL